MAEGRLEDVVRHADRVFETNALNAPPAIVIAARTAIRRRDQDRARAWLERLSGLGVRGPALGVDRSSIAAGVAALEGDWPGAAARYREAAGRYREFELELSRGLKWLEVLTLAPAFDPLVGEAVDDARAIFERSGAAVFGSQLIALVEERSDVDRAIASEMPARSPAADAVTAGPGSRATA